VGELTSAKRLYKHFVGDTTSHSHPGTFFLLFQIWQLKFLHNSVLSVTSKPLCSSFCSQLLEERYVFPDLHAPVARMCDASSDSSPEKKTTRFIIFFLDLSECNWYDLSIEQILDPSEHNWDRHETH